MAYLKAYRPHKFHGSSKEIVDKANEILTEMSQNGYTLTLRQLYYQFVRRNWLANEEKQYKRLGSLVTKAREAGVMDWYAIEDRGRSCYGPQIDENAASVVRGIESQLQMDFWARQDHYLEVWVEKQALESVLARPCRRLRVNHMACKGYLSASEAWRAGLRFKDAANAGKHCTLIHLADHDPSGLNMTDDNRDRVRLFAETNNVEIRRIALTIEQIKQYECPPNPAKETDSRAGKYVKEFGPSSWELDALQPSVIEGLIEDTVREYIDEDTWAGIEYLQEEARRPLRALSANWDKVEGFLHDQGLI